MEQQKEQLEQLKDFVREVLAIYSCEHLFSEDATEAQFNSCPYCSSLYRLAQRIADSLIFSHHNAVCHAAF